MLAFDYVFIAHINQHPLAIRSELQVSMICLADIKILDTFPSGLVSRTLISPAPHHDLRCRYLTQIPLRLPCSLHLALPEMQTSHMNFCL
jgi:hypothetical protein